MRLYSENKVEYQEEIIRLMREITTTRAGRNTLLDASDASNKLDVFIACLLNSFSSTSVEHAMKELHTALVLEATREAGKQYRQTLEDLQEDAAMTAYANRQERCEAWV